MLLDIKRSAAELPSINEEMMKHLKRFEAQGLSGSIYTEPYDVETGLLTYDPEIIKIPFGSLRRIHATLVPPSIGADVDPGSVPVKVVSDPSAENTPLSHFLHSALPSRNRRTPRATDRYVMREPSLTGGVSLGPTNDASGYCA